MKGKQWYEEHGKNEVECVWRKVMTEWNGWMKEAVMNEKREEMDKRMVVEKDEQWKVDVEKWWKEAG